MRRYILVFAGFAMGLLAASIYRTSQPAPRDAQVTAASDGIPLGLSRQQLLDVIAADNKLDLVLGQPSNRYVVELNKSGATVAIDGPSDAPRTVTFTTPYNNDTAPVARPSPGAWPQ